MQSCFRLNEEEIEQKDKIAFEQDRAIDALNQKVQNLKKALEESQSQHLR